LITQAIRFAIDVSDQRVVLPNVIIKVLKWILSKDAELEKMYKDLFFKYFPRGSSDALKQTYEPVFLILALLIKKARNRFNDDDLNGFQALLNKMNEFIKENYLAEGIFLEHIIPFTEAIKNAGLWKHFVHLLKTKKLEEMQISLAYIPAFLAKNPDKIAELLKKDMKGSIFTSLEIVEAIDESGIYDLLKEALKKVEFEELPVELQILGKILQHSNQVLLIAKAMKKAGIWEMFVEGLSEFGGIEQTGDIIKAVLDHLKNRGKVLDLETLTRAFKYHNIFDALAAIFPKPPLTS
jgi:hypothetical protein